MPTYAYQCEDCGHTFDRFQRMSDPPVDQCPACGAPVRRLIEAGTGFIMKGGKGGGHGRRNAEGGCALETTGRTCCGRNQRCDRPGCGGER